MYIWSCELHSSLVPDVIYVGRECILLVYVLFQQYHYTNVIMGTIVSQITSLMFTQAFIQAQIKESIKAPRHWPLRGEFTGDRWIPAQMASYAENVSIWWRHHFVQRFDMQEQQSKRLSWDFCFWLMVRAKQKRTIKHNYEANDNVHIDIHCHGKLSNNFSWPRAFRKTQKKHNYMYILIFK